MVGDHVIAFICVFVCMFVMNQWAYLNEILVKYIRDNVHNSLLFKMAATAKQP